MTIDRFEGARPCSVVVFTSPKAGSGASREQVPRLIELLSGASVDCQVIHAVDELAERIVSRSTTHQMVVVAAGGDGTLSLAVATVAGAMQDASQGSPPQKSSDGVNDASLDGSQPVLVPMPLGTENLLARHFGHRADAESVVNTIRRGPVHEIDSGLANGHTFLIMATCGFDAEVVRAMHLTRRGHISRLSYLRPILRAIKRYKFPPLAVRIDGGEPMECRWAMAFNIPRYGGGLNIMPKAVDNDGLMDVILFGSGSVVSGMRYVLGIWLRGHMKYSDVIHRRGRALEVTCGERVPYQLDGDYAGRLPMRISVQPGSVRLLVPPN